MRMWEINNHSPFPATAGFQRDAVGHSHYVIAISASFLVDGAGRVAFDPDQPPPRQSPLHLADDPDQLLIEDVDLGLPLPDVDVLVHADAVLPAGQPRHRVSLQVGAMRRDLDVLAAAVRDQGGAPRLTGDTAAVALDWRAAAGGADNPLGLRPLRDGDPLPRLVAAGQGHDTTRPVSLSPIPAAWPQRVALAGTFDAEWQRRKAPLLPDDYDPRFGHAAEAAQIHQGPLPDAGQVVLTGMASPAGDPPWEFHLPVLPFRVECFHRGAWQQRPAQLQRLLIDARAGRIRMVYKASLTLARIADDVLLRETRISLIRPLGFAVAAAAAPGYHDPAADPTQKEPT